MRRASVLALLAGAALAACSFFHGDFPDDVKCKSNADCWEFQGEKCNVSTGQCFVPGPADAAVPVPDGPPVPDAAPDADLPDAGPDADLPDGALPDV